MRNKIIGISANILMADDRDNFRGYYKQRIFSGYIDSVISAGGTPIIVPVTDNYNVLDNTLNLLDGLIISGGYDVDPIHYGEESTTLIKEICPLRDTFEMYLIKNAISKNIPVLGICRGHQLLNVVCGGTLYQDMSLLDNSFIKHVQEAPPEHPTHKVKILEGSHLSKVFGLESLVNSYHHQSIKDIAPNFKATAISTDNVIEAIEHIDSNKTIIGVQWHPEMMSKHYEETLDLFKYFISKC